MPARNRAAVRDRCHALGVKTPGKASPTNNGLWIPVDTLRRAASTLLDHVEGLHGPVVNVGTDMFWVIDPAERDNVYSTPTNFSIGQLSEALRNVTDVCDDPERAISYALVWLSDLLRATGEAVDG